MGTRISSLLWLAVVTSVVFCPSGVSAKSIHAVRGKKYRLTKQHGPWMIMVASFKQPPPEVKTKGLSPAEAADELVYELRKKGIPAYAFRQDGMVGHINTHDRMGRQSPRIFAAQRGMISVLAGNYRSIDPKTRQGKLAQDSLSKVKKLHPKFLRSKKSGARYRRSPGRSGPLAGAFLTVNPLLSPEEARARKHDPLLLKLNSGVQYSLLENSGKYSLVVASFYGKSVTQLSNDKFRKAAEKFKVADSLDEAMYSAWELAGSLRQARRLGYDRDFEAYVFHGRYHSVVTIGSFDSPQDPRIAALKQLFGAKIKTDPSTGKDALVAEFFTIPRNPQPNVPPRKSWIFDPYPKLMEVPTVR